MQVFRFFILLFNINLLYNMRVLLFALVAELADAQRSGRCLGFQVQVRLLPRAYKNTLLKSFKSYMCNVCALSFEAFYFAKKSIFIIRRES